MSREAASETLMRFGLYEPNAATESLKTITESEGVRVYITRYSDRPALCVQVTLKTETHTTALDIAENEIGEIESAVRRVVEAVKDRAYLLRLAALDALLDHDMRLNTEQGRKAFVGLLDDGKLDQADIEQLAIELMQHVERVPR